MYQASLALHSRLQKTSTKAGKAVRAHIRSQANMHAVRQGPTDLTNTYKDTQSGRVYVNTLLPIYFIAVHRVEGTQ